MNRIIVIVEVLLQATPDQQQHGKNDSHTHCGSVQQRGTSAQFKANKPETNI